MKRQLQGWTEGVLNRSGRCRVCGRALRDPQSVARGVGPVCWRRIGGGIFDGVLDADERTWAERERCLQAGGEYDLGCNWQMAIDNDRYAPAARVSIRYNRDTGQYEVYAAAFDHATGQMVEHVLYTTADIRDAFRAGVQAGPELTAAVEAARRDAVRAWRQQVRGGRTA